MNYEDVKKQIENIIDPGFNQPLGHTQGIQKLVIGPTGIIELEIRLKDRKKDENNVKLEIVKLVKITLGFPGIKLTFFDSDFTVEGQKNIAYLAIASGKGGVGKSTVTANLAYALTRIGKKVAIIDADVYGASITYVMGLKIRPIEAYDDDKMLPLEKDHIEVMSTEFFMPSDKPLMWRGPMLGKMLTHFFGGVKWHDETDIILIDLPPGTGDVAIDVKTYVPKSKVLVVTTPHINASNVAVKAGLGAQQIGHDVIGVVENMSYYFNSCNQKREFLFGEGGGKAVADKLNVDLVAQIPIGQPLQKGSYIFQADEIQGKFFQILAHFVTDKMGI